MAKKTKITGKAKRELKKLAKDANKHHQDVKIGLLSALDNAHRCGEILIQAKALVKHGQWKRWLRKNFSASYETAADYMRVARCWNDDRLVEAREHGYALTSIKNVLDVIKEEHAKEQPKDKTVKPPPEPLTDRQKRAALGRCHLRTTFDYWLRELDADELYVFEVMFNRFECGWWDGLHNYLKEIIDKVSDMLEEEMGYEQYDEERKEKILYQKVKKALWDKTENIGKTSKKGKIPA